VSIAGRRSRILRSVTVTVEVATQATPELVEAFGRLLPQLSRSAAPLDADALARILGHDANTLFVARAADGTIVGTLTLVMVPIPSGLRARIEDVVVDEAARGQGVGTALTQAAIDAARRAGARTLDLTSRPDRDAAGRLYERLGFRQRDSRLYRYAEQ
jgi:ribosomal protein S18 acetylase RimI-like enzyme